ncbi:MAG: hypothetical protein A3B89_03585 [Candidatus Buchananbacteria bacterium RIFCSPHIGHO2_02_FULL_40_13]|uniref:NlpC/P60 domain-containing protein n=1 Tax=Candidatus Buchananbacteria bacterium RIFCSPLOWO2_01_FULL_39_33 TaxID=1797543 RepID=A0A1G1YKA7_9BACT|nr:MAG: hypothetical protein A2820_00100 [Candidatus Buchananbacteria bacterium RIFCSPHIGHO2_01_FULL_40_35]OGY50047.1 MAG: hypothetical protein A3B89_03585 [Candidatus Buchananbacteria bacterium RIFCSPHIGHO2_02_FULL_40_13]OGY52704.1 MAG: hypothetical protein A3A02_02590 [Candidatus Buchananbacteria bacterium RIFCSPLOWO2_01_FULL_39_33]
MEKITIIKKDNYLVLIKNSIGGTTWRQAYGLINGRKKNLTQNGDLACAYFVSSILKIFDLIGNLHLTVTGTIKDLENSGWEKITKNKISPGDIIIWQAKNNHQHIGFYLGDKKAVSNDSKTGKIKSHHYTFKNQREIEEVWRHKI